MKALSPTTDFPNYTQLPKLLPNSAWMALRTASVGIAFGLILTLLIEPDLGLFLLWRVIIPFVPLLFFTAPGLWRNLCPLAAANQTPRVFQVTKALEAPEWLKRWGYAIGISLFVFFVTLRKVTLNYSGPVLAAVLTLILGAAFTMGMFFKGKSGWCSSICPLLPVQRIYGQTPFLTVANSHCQPCVGCTKNCYDFNPHAAYLADMHDDDTRFSGYRKYFVGLFPGFVLAYYLLPDPGRGGLSELDNPLPWRDGVADPSTWSLLDTSLAGAFESFSVLEMYGWFAIFMLASAGLFALANTFLTVSVIKITTLFGAAAITIYYWYNAPLIASLGPEGSETAITWIVRAVVGGLSLLWIDRTWQREQPYLEYTAEVPVSLTVNQTLIAHRAKTSDQPEVTVEDHDLRVVVEPGTTLLAMAEANGLPIESGCRMGVCGADPVSIIRGMENLSKVGSDERGTIDRLGGQPNTRMACVTKVKGECAISLSPAEPASMMSVVVPAFAYDKTVSSVVVVGNGIAGVTVADHVRRRHPDCEIHLLSDESHHLYNRMAITRLLYGRSAMDGLYLMAEKWYTDNRITVWLNTQVEAIDIDNRRVELGTGETLDYDRLVLTTGGRSFVPPIDGYGEPGSFVLREAADAIEIRRFVQQHRARHGVIAGGGLLGLEAAYGLTKLGMEVTVLERGGALLRRQLDAAASGYLQRYLEGLGMAIMTQAETESLQSEDGRLRQVTLVDGRTTPAEVFLVAAGVRSNTGLAESAGIEVGRGIIVDDQMRTSAPDVYAAGDAAAHDGAVMGLWTVAAKQGEVAAINVAGGNETYEPIVPVTMLKVAGIDLTSIGRFEPEDGDEVILFEDPANHLYRKLVLRDGAVVGAILIGWPDEARALSEVVKERIDISAVLDTIRGGDWSPLVEIVE